MWLHYFDPHWSYRDHAEINFGMRPIDYYDEEIRYTDQQIERLFSAIESTALIKDTYFIIHSDHGEAFEERGKSYKRHGQSLFNDQVHIPMLILGPKIPSRRINTPVSLIDIMPTILEIAQVEVLPPEPRGASLLKFSSRSDAEHHPIFIEMLKDSTHKARYAIVKWPWKLHYIRDYSRYVMYNLSKDPFEEIDRSDWSLDVFDHLKRRLKLFLRDDLVPLDPYRYESKTPILKLIRSAGTGINGGVSSIGNYLVWRIAQ